MSGKGTGRPPLVAMRRGSTSRPKAAAKPAPARKRSPKRPQRRGGIIGFFAGIVRFIWRMIWGATWRVTALVAVVLGASVWFFHSTLPPLADQLDGRARGSVTMLDRNGAVFAWRGETFGGQISARNVSKHLRNAVVATEDRRFYSHFGVSPRGIASAIRINLSEGRGPFSGNGGSTITQQVAKLLCLGTPYDVTRWKTEAAYEEDCRAGSLVRKIKEVPFALAMETKYTKEEVLTIYLNRAYLGAGARGFEAAAQRYFGVSANEVNPQQAAMLAGLLVAPSYYAPTRNLQRAQERANLVLGLMQEQGFLTPAETAAARANPATLSDAAEARAGGYFADWVMDSAPSFLTSDTTEDVVIRTTLDQRLQKAAETALADIFETKVREGSKAEAAVVVMSADGAVRAMVGGRQSKVSGAFNRATHAKRQTGSAFKPFVYAAAMDLGYSPADYVEDKPLTINVRGSGPWSPKNYTNDYKGMVTLTEALKQSLNIPAVRISEAVGRDKVRRVAEQFGIVSDLANGPALALGVSEASLLEMTGAYAGILNGGSSVAPYGLIELRLQGEREPLITQEGGIGERVISQQAAEYLTYMMSEVIDSGTGGRAKLGNRPAAGKTGTTQAARDAWFVGFTADYVAGVWMGYDENIPLTGVTGGGLPAEIWNEVMLRVHDGLEVRPLPMKVPESRLPPTQPSGGGQVQPVEPRSSGVRPAEPAPDLAERVLNDVLRALGAKN
ncbi:MAG: PBP1A family penicillin-binding protein [Gemmobacter sp.]|nr:PBP1A family penicillin-binding protein [Gemmobacter sp.]